MNNTEREKLGTLKISEDVIALCAAEATLKTTGVAGLSGTLTGAITKNLLGKENPSKGIKVSTDDVGYVIDIFVVVLYGVKIPGVAWDIQENVKKEIEHMTAEKVSAVNIHVQGVEFPIELEEDQVE